MERKQVSLDLDTPALRPTSQLGGQYSVAVQATPKTNSALQLAQALRYTPQVLGQASNIAKQLGAEAAANVDNVEDAMLDDETKGILGYDKAYQQGLVKRHFSMNEEAIKERFRNIASDPDALKMSPDEFLGRLGAERQEFNNELMDSFGGNANREQAIQALSSTFVDELVDATSSEWVANKKQQTEMLISGDTQALFSTQGVDKGLAYMSEEYGRLGMAPKERAGRQRNAVMAHFETLVASGHYSKADELLKQADQYKIKNAGKLFGSTEGVSSMTAMRKALKKAQITVEENLKPLKDNVEIANDTVANLFLSSRTFDTKRTGMVNALLAAKVPQDEAEEAVDKLFTEGMTPNEMWQSWNTLTADLSATSGDLTRTLLGSIQDDNLKITLDGAFAEPVLGITTQEQYNEADEKILNYLIQNPTASLKEIPLGANVPKSDTRVLDMFETHSAAVKWRNDEASQFKYYRNEYTAKIESERDLGVDFAGEFKSLLRQEAQGVWDASGRDIDEFNTAIRAKAIEIYNDVKEEAKIQKGLNSRIRDYIRSSEDRQKAIKDAKEKDDPWGPDKLRDDLYPLLQSENTGDVDPKELVDERKRMLEDKQAGALTKGSLLIYGFPTLESYDETIRAKASVGFQDFPLGAEVLESLRSAASSWEIENPSKAEQKAIQFWRSQGYRSAAELNEILDAQISYYQLGY